MFTRCKLVLNIFSLTFLLISQIYCSATDNSSSEEIDDSKSLRLPNETRPITYNLHLRTNIHTCDQEFNGSVVIKLKAINNTDKIVLHAGNFSQIKVDLVKADDGHRFENVTFNIDKATTFLTITAVPLALNLKAGKEYILTISYKSYHTDMPFGFFRSKYFSSANRSDVCFAITDFEPLYARRAFPCYDEPSFKANFTVAITHGWNYTAISSMPQDGEPIVNSKNGMITTKFKQTPLMSTYYLAFGVINHESISRRQYNVTHRIFSPLDSTERGEFALDIATESLKTFENYLGISFALPKIDHISVRDRTGTAMENWGLIVYQDGYLLPSSNVSNLFNAKIASLIVHELAHQWFGNLVTPKWWSSVWLSEGLTTFYSDKILDMIHPEWEIIDFFMCGEMTHTVFNLPSYEPLTHYVESESDIEDRFGFESYRKAAYVLKMFEKALTDSTFKKGIVNYLKKLQYSVAEEDDLFNSLQAAATEDKVKFFSQDEMVSMSMKTWTHQSGHPIITATRNYHNGEILLQQGRFFNANRTQLYAISHEHWYIPITFATASHPDFYNTTTDFVFPNRASIIISPDKPLREDDWIVFNKQQIGPYRVMYDQQNWNLIINALKTNPKAIHPHNKAQLLRDAGDFARAKILPDKVLFDLLLCVKDDDDLIVWSEVEKILYKIRKDIEGIASEEVFDYFARDFIKNIFNKNFENLKEKTASVFSEYFRVVLFGFACDIQLVECTILAKKLFDDLEEMNTKDMSSLFKKEIYREVFKRAKEEDFPIILNRFNKENDELEMLVLMEGLVLSGNLKLMEYLTIHLINKIAQAGSDEQRRIDFYSEFLENIDKYL